MNSGRTRTREVDMNKNAKQWHIDNYMGEIGNYLHTPNAKWTDPEKARHEALEWFYELHDFLKKRDDKRVKTSCWVVLRNYDYEGQSIQAVFDNEISANEYCEQDKTTMLWQTSVEKWGLHNRSEKA